MFKTTSWLNICTIFGIINLAFGKVAEKDLFPFGSENGDSLVPAGDGGHTPQPVHFPGGQIVFSNYIYYSLYVNTNGVISFNAPIDYGTPLCQKHDYRTISIFPYWAEIDTSQGLGGAVYYRQSKDFGLINKAAQDIQAAYPYMALAEYQIDWLFIITWYQAPFGGAAACGHTNATVPRNTFQAVLVSGGGGPAFAIFYYSNITWTTGTKASGDCSGLGGVQARAGFESQDVYSIYDIPNSCSNGIVNIDESSNCNSPGKWVLRVDVPLPDEGAAELHKMKSKEKRRPATSL